MTAASLTPTRRKQKSKKRKKERALRVSQGKVTAVVRTHPRWRAGGLEVRLMQFRRLFMRVDVVFIRWTAWALFLASSM